MENQKTVAIHQPNFLPWLGYFHKIWVSDVFVFLDDVEYTKNGYINRNRIKTPQGEQWMTVPVIYSGRSKQKINETEIFNPEKSLKKVLATIEMNYKKTPYFTDYYEGFRDIMKKEQLSLFKLNIALIHWICESLDIKTEIRISSEIGIIEEDATKRLIKICNKLAATTYVSGFGGQKYQEEDQFNKAGIQLVTSGFKQQEYKQLWGEFIPFMSTLDALFNTGQYCKDLVRKMK